MKTLDAAFDEGRDAFRRIGDYWPSDPVGEARRANPYGRLTIAAFVWERGFDHELRSTTGVTPFGTRFRLAERAPTTETPSCLERRTWWRRLREMIG